MFLRRLRGPPPLLAALCVASWAAACAPSPDSGLDQPRLTLEAVPFGQSDSLTMVLIPVDIDGDDVLELAVGTGKHEPAANLLHRSADGGLLNVEEPLGEDMDSTFGLAFGDLDADGLLDFVAANDAGYPNRICLQQPAGAFDCQARWRGWESRDIDLSDLNGDGLLDMVFTNKYQPDQIFHGGNLDWDPPPFVDAYDADQPSPVEPFGHMDRGSVDAAIGDMDGDGAPDIAVACRGTHPSALHRVTPDGVADATYLKLGQARALALADVDDDGALDLLVGTLGQPNLMIMGRLDGSLAQPVALGEQTHNTWAIAAADLDGDGLLDLIEGNAWGPDNIRFGAPGGFERALWELDPVEGDTRAIAVGDFDGDGDTDFAVGRYGQQDLLFLVE